ncbi:MAG: DUF3794 domain-containing protein [Limnochordia bacterium]|nr:DUF3794 domain-containing protein [Limnochordia bacterium]MDD2628665.1 DUF3794 domain-containing protein [Limnochordia bacterium]MDD4516896.1 DUF3794 domain-containing protein [Limnochordia bacterium]
MKRTLCPIKPKVCQKPPFTIERFKVLRVIGEKVAQVVESGTVNLPNPAIKVDRIDINLINVTHAVFQNKVIKQGQIDKQIFYVDETDTVRHEEVIVPFEAIIEIPGVSPEMDLEIQNRLLCSDVVFELLTPTVLLEKVVLDILVKVSEYVQRDLLVAQSNIISTRVV